MKPITKIILLSVLTLNFELQTSNCAAQPTLTWAKSMGGTNTDYSTSIAVDASGNIYTTGTFQDTADFDPGTGTYNLTALGSNFDIFVSKLDAAGNFVWAKSIGGISNDAGFSIVLDGSGNVYTTGYFIGTADFDPGASVFNLTTAGSTDIFVSKLDAIGNFLWAKSMGGISNDCGYSIALDGIGNVYTTGYFSGTADFDPGAGTYNLTSAGGVDIFVSKLDAAGNFVWAKSMGGGITNVGHSIAVDSSGNIYTTGTFQDTADFDPGAGTYNLTSVGFYDIFVSKLDAAGNFVWAKSIGGTITDWGYSIALDSIGNVYATGLFRNTVDFDPGAGTYNLTSAGGGDIFVSKLDAAGNFMWAIRIGGGSDDEYANSIALSPLGNRVYIMGDQYSNTVDYDPGLGVYNLINMGTEANFIAQYDNNGNFVCAMTITPGNNETFFNRHLAVDGIGKVWAAASFDDTAADFDPCTAFYNPGAYGNNDIYVAKYDFSWCSCGSFPPCLANAGSDVIICVGDSVTLGGTPTASGGDSSYVYEWSPSVGLNDSTLANPIASPTITTSYVVTIDDENGCTSTDTLTVTVNPTASGTDTQTACNSLMWIDGINYTASTNTPTFTIIGGSVHGCDSVVTLNLTLTIATTTTNVFNECEGFSVTVGANTYTTTGIFTDILNGCDTVITNLTINPAPQLTLIKVDDNCGGNIGSITAIVSTNNPPITYVWNTGSTDSIINNLPAGLYSIIVADNNNCTNTDSVLVLNITTSCEQTIFIPNVFSPNGDNQNDLFITQLVGFEFENLKIYNRWGMLLFETKSANEGWDGRTTAGINVSDGTYFFILNYKNKEEKQVEKGTLTLLR